MKAAAPWAVGKGTYVRGLWALNRYLIPYWPLEALVLLIVFLKSFFSLLGPYLARITIDQAFGNRDLYLFHILILVGFVLFFFQGGLGVLQKYLSAYIGRLLTFDLRSEYTRHLFRLSFPDLHRRSTGEQIYRLGADIDSVSTLATDSIPSVLSSSVRLIFLLAICTYLNWKLTLATLLLSPLFYFQARYFGLRQKELTRRFKQKSQDTLSGLQDALANVKLVKAFGKEGWAVRRYLRHRISLIRISLAQVRLSIFGNVTAGFLNTAAMTGFTYYIGYNVIRGRVSLGTLVALMLYLGQLFASIKSLAGLYRGIMMKFVSWERVQETLGTAVETERSDAHAFTVVRGEVGYQSVRFGYLPHKAVLGNVSFRIRAGQYTAVVGPSGSGKTTLLLLLLRLLRPWQGRITIDDCDLRDIRWRSLRSHLGVALQEGFVLNRSIRENLQFGRPAAVDAEMWWALEIADLAQTVRETASGLATVVGEGGSNLSEGQRQRLSIARAVLGRPEILILDEATSSVGFDSEAKILSNIRRELFRSTLLVASHRLLSLQNADRILVLSEGTLAEEGTHAELLRRGGCYSFLFNEQFRNREAEV